MTTAPGQPSPHREPGDHRLLITALAAGPAGWIAQLVIDYALSSHGCTARRVAGAASGPAFDAEVAILVGLNLACLAIVVAGGVFCRRAWTKVDAEKEGAPAAAPTVGEERTRFLAVCGTMAAVGFAIAVLFNTVEPLVMPACWTGVS